MRVRDIMTKDPISVHPSLDLPEAVRLLKEHHIRRLPVTTHDRVCGIVTDRDLKAAGPSRANSLDIWDLAFWLSRTTIYEIMKTPVITISPDAPVANAAVLMYQHKIGGMPVVDEDDHLVGIVTSTDVLNQFSEMLGAAPGCVQAIIADSEDNRKRLADVVTLSDVSTLVFEPERGEIHVVFRGSGRVLDVQALTEAVQARGLAVSEWRVAPEEVSEAGEEGACEP